MNEIEGKIIAIIADKSDRQPAEIKFTDHLKNDLDFDSLDGVELCMEIEKAFSISFSDEEMEKITTVQDAVEMVKAKFKK